MPRFAYTAKDGNKQEVKGSLTAESEREAIEKLDRMGCFPVSLREEEIPPAPDKRPSAYRFFTRIQKRDVSLFMRQLADLIEAGLTLNGALTIISRQTENPHLGKIVADLDAIIRDGAGFSEALAHYPKIFSPLLVNMVKSGEVGGMLAEVLARLADFSEAEEELRAKVRFALAYPALILFVGIATIVVLLTFVIPKMVSLFQEVGQVLPLPTRILMEMSRMIVSYGWFLLAMVIVGAGLLRQLAHSQEGKLALDRMKLRFPIWGPLITKVETARFARSLGLLLKHGVAILQAVEVVTQSMVNEVMKSGMRKIREQLEGGASLSHAMHEYPVFPVFVTNMVAVGEESGTLDRSLLKIGEAYEREADRTMKLMAALIEPVMILVMGLVVGFIVVSMLLPIFQIDLLSR
jgi:general secretion pathway protein F